MNIKRVLTVVSVSLLATCGSLAAQESQIELRALARERLALIGAGASSSQIAEIDARMRDLQTGQRLGNVSERSFDRLDRAQGRVSRRVDDVRDVTDETVEDVRDTDLPRGGRADVSAGGEVRTNLEPPYGRAVGYETRGRGSFDVPNTGGFGVSGESSGSVRGLGVGVNTNTSVGLGTGGGSVGIGGEIGGGVGRVDANVGGTVNGAVGTGIGALR